MSLPSIGAAFAGILLLFFTSAQLMYNIFSPVLSWLFSAFGLDLTEGEANLITIVLVVSVGLAIINKLMKNFAGGYTD